MIGTPEHRGSRRGDDTNRHVGGEYPKTPDPAGGHACALGRAVAPGPDES